MVGPIVLLYGEEEARAIVIDPVGTVAVSAPQL